MEQLWLAIEAVFGSWNNPRAIKYRELNSIPGNWGTAVNVQAMVFGNMGEDSGTGVAFTRDPSTGEKMFYGEFLMNAQGEDVVAGIRTPMPIAKLEEINKDVYKELVEVKDRQCSDFYHPLVTQTNYSDILVTAWVSQSQSRHCHISPI